MSKIMRKVQQKERIFEDDGIALNINKSMSESDMRRVAAFIDSSVGIQLPKKKQSLVEGRLRKRMIHLGYSGFHRYLDYVFNSDEGLNEQKQLIDVITTNKTNFFREAAHFEYLVETVIVEKIKESAGNHRETIKIWSAGCSTGEEAYTLAMVLAEAQSATRTFDYEILATDVSVTCLQTAGRGIYTERQINSIPLTLRKKYLLKSRNPADQLVQMGPVIRRCIRFDSCNLMDNNFSVTQKMDIIFCRNVMIYFNSETKEALVAKFEKQLSPGGYLFVGHSESLNGMQTNMVQVAPMVYRKKDS